MNTEQLIERFYSSFQKKDWRGMLDCYHEKILFSDPVFQDLKGNRAKAMWHMLVQAGHDLAITYSSVKGDPQRGTCHWEARYTFSRTGRKVHNIIDAEFIVQEGKFIRHTDTFDLWRWSRMALGMPGLALGWSGLLQNKVRAMAQKGLDKFIREHPTYAQM